ncbi:MAG: hypothetical protein JW841_07200 [Deltaproteobacteria bacterium]|nr:hypothetical protein [Deltaproteobacteria bacterium]
MKTADLIIVDANNKSKPFERLNPFILSRPKQAELDMPSLTKSALWIVKRAHDISDLVAYWRAYYLKSNIREQRLLLLEHIDSSRIDFLNAFFKSVIVRQNDVSMLNSADIAEVLAASNHNDLFIGGRVDAKDKVITLYRGDMSRLVAPFSLFSNSSGHSKPNFTDFEIIDYGQTIKLGNYEASADAILFELDADYRRRAKKNRLKKDRSFGAALRRLRLQRGLRLNDFLPDVTEKEMGRIERNEVKNPHQSTIQKIAERLNVNPNDIVTY